ncbi:tyrosine-type recombinase/integrase [Leptospira weilii]|uniref:Site-specific recombinase, phage integrase family n=1 Tax=Leptospira weilii str. 2006001855 TaxID=996804 RepID=M6FEF0_9LEPT|nr:tyrosine-type recombinase/integrase [Leptospira weilii]EMM70815.1 site-specific recombinase, phage integrase family [Leptospira weilii str. 2006001855]EMN46818.1 site-specific recombinase, phage integrase family [Leptospira weilii str. LNT 1234]MCL8268414.1 tyrosine-type recombinase/integrase [Leptospira weilii]QDK22189.1 site-specific integrase [Leptospira weilii]QDK26134.1 site-specific integrase [Leptospira weilii]
MSTSSNVLFIADFKFEQRRKRENQDGATGSALGKGLTDKTMCDLTRSFAQPISERDYRNRALFSLMSKTGLRAKEVVSLKFSNIFSAPSGESLIKYLKKGGNLGYAVIAEETLAFIREYHFIIDYKGDYFFLSMPGRNQYKRNPLTTRGLQLIVNSWGVKTCSGRMVHPHALRFTTGAKLLETSGSIAAQKVLGHSSPVTTSKYYTKPYFDGSKFLSWE